MDQDKILTHSRVNVTFSRWLVLLDNSLRNDSIRKTHPTINTIKINFGKKKTFKISRAIVHVTPEVLSVTDNLSASTVKRLAVEQGKFLKRE